MPLRLIVTTPGISIYYDEINQWLYAEWQGVHTQESTQAAGLLLLDALRQQPSSKMLNDTSSISSTSADLSTWDPWWLQELVGAGLRHIAWVYPRLFANRDATEHILIHVKPIIVTTFDDVATACLWLQKQASPLTHVALH
ncbi:hypothetical protein H8B15_09800 [Hymenobacter sp. BT507]|uniref:STAS/SEC14 domain-containing protein n=1 Tax=Hymenobacter citatus TaxID=2763506 RepID=A0ABR7MKV0_9BACT|nr:hypothetical protein [Hymenobacter citatus]MBC6611217.1 hypothetical protein [Hymenobacter citatus]